MVNSAQDRRRYRAALSLLIIFCLAAVYMTTYSARIESGDSLRLFDSASSLIRFGDPGQDESLSFTPLAILVPYQNYRIAPHESGTELSIYLTAALYQIADWLPGLGFVHTAWLLNIFVLALAGCVFFWLVLACGYTERTAVVASLVCGTATIILPYSKTLFREPQTMLCLLITALALLNWQKSRGWRSVLWLTGAIVAFIAAYLFKESALMALPALLLLALPVPKRIALKEHQTRILRRTSDFLLITLIAAAVIVIYSESLFNVLLNPANPLLSRFDTTFTRAALHTYLFSVGGSIMGSSPILLLAIPGVVWLIRQNQRRLVWFVVLVIAGYAAGHAVLTGVHWFGGLSWSPRFMLPVIPFVMLAALPVLNHLVYPGRSRWLMAFFIALMGYSAWVNFNAVALPWWHYQALLPPDVPFEWSDGLNRIEYLRWVLQPGSWVNLGFDFAWTRAGIPGWIPVYAGYALVMLAGQIILLRRGKVVRYQPAVLIGAGLVSILLVGLSLRQLNDTDSLYQQRPELAQLMDVLEAESKPGDVLILTDNVYANFVMNNNRLKLRAITLPPLPGERSNAEDTPDAVSHNPVDLIMGNRNYLPPAILDDISTQHERLWVLTNMGPYLPWSVRPVERYLSMHHYLLRTFETTDPAVRLLEYSTIDAPDPYDFLNPETLTDLRFNDTIALEGYTLPEGRTYQPGDVLPISFYWRAQTKLATDYVVAWFVARADGTIVPIQGRDTQPYDGFAPTTSWQPGLALWDNHALRLPADLPAGEYSLWVVLYQFTADGSTERLSVTGDTVKDGTIGVLPGVIKISNER